MPKKSTLAQTVEALHKARWELQEAEASLEIEHALFQSKNKKKLERVEAAKLAVQLNDETLRKAMIKEYNDTGQIALGEGLNIKMRISVNCTDPDKLREWAIHNMTWLLDLDMSKVEAIAKMFPDAMPHVFVNDVPTPFVAKDLSKTITSINKG